MGGVLVLSLVVVIISVARISRSGGGREEALKEADRSLEVTRRYFSGTRRPIHRGHRLVDRMRAWTDKSV